MKWIVLTIALSLSSLAPAQDVTVIQINAKWNRSNTVDELRNLKGCDYVRLVREPATRDTKHDRFRPCCRCIQG